MEKNDAKNAIVERLTKIATSPNVEVIFAYIDTTVGSAVPWTMIPFLNIYGGSVYEEDNIDNRMKRVEDEDSIECLYDIIDFTEECDFEINLSQFFPEWPDNTENGEEEILETIRAAIENKTAFAKVRKLFFFHVDCSANEIVKVIDR